MKKIWLFLFLSMTSFGMEVDFLEGKDRKIQLLDRGRVRVNETFLLKSPTKEVTFNNFPENIKRESLVVENQGILDTVFSIRKTDKKSIETSYIGREVEYQDEKYNLLSLSPLIIERQRDGRVIINPESEIAMKAIEGDSRGNTLKVIGEDPIQELKVSYEYDKLKWQKMYNLNLDSRSFEDVIVLKNDTNRDFEDLDLIYGRIHKVSIDLGAHVEKKLDISQKNVKIETSYIYRSSQAAEHPHMELKVLGEKLSGKSSASIIENGRYIGEMASKDSRGQLSFQGLIERRVDIGKKVAELKFGEKLSRNSVDFSIKNYKAEKVVVKIIYDELPQRWYEMKSPVPYEVSEKGIEFTIVVPANSRKEVNFSYIMEKI